MSLLSTTITVSSANAVVVHYLDSVTLLSYHGPDLLLLTTAVVSHHAPSLQTQQTTTALCYISLTQNTDPKRNLTTRKHAQHSAQGDADT